VEYVLRLPDRPSLESLHVQTDPARHTQIPPATPEINRLRAAAALIPIIEQGLEVSRFSVERAALMASFCEWTAHRPYDDPEAIRLAERVRHGLQRIKLPLAAR